MRFLLGLALAAFVLAVPLGCSDKKKDSNKDPEPAPKDKPQTPGAPPKVPSPPKK